MIILTILIFIAGYFAIAFEHSLGINKAASALITGVLCWLLYFLQQGDSANGLLLHHLGEIASILFFLLGAMTIVELIDSYNGFDAITNRIATRSKRKLLYIIAIITFFLSALLDNLTTAIVMISLCQKILNDKEDRLWFAGMVIIAANAGGAWSPLGDVTTTMLWIGGQVTALNIIIKTFIPAVAACIVPLLYIAYKYRNQQFQPATREVYKKGTGNIMLLSGIGFLLFVPVFKTITHMPPFMGMLFALGCMWMITSFMKVLDTKGNATKYTVTHALQRIDTPSILFFLGILLSISALQSFGILKQLAIMLDTHLRNDYLVGISLGILSSIVDNVPLVAAAQGMYNFSQYPPDHFFWEFLALTTGTGGSIIIIGSAAGVAVMGLERISFLWYLKKISFLAFLGFAAGVAMFAAQQFFIIP